MNHIYWDVNHISMLTDELGASAHSHGMIQFFLALNNRPDIKVGRKKLERPVCLFVQKSRGLRPGNVFQNTCFRAQIQKMYRFANAHTSSTTVLRGMLRITAGLRRHWRPRPCRLWAQNERRHCPGGQQGTL